MIASKINIVMFYLCYATNSIYSAKQSPQSKYPIVNAPSQKCSISEFTCANNNCISASQFCNNNDDCGDASDEPRFCTSELKLILLIESTWRCAFRFIFLFALPRTYHSPLHMKTFSNTLIMILFFLLSSSFKLSLCEQVFAEAQLSAFLIVSRSRRTRFYISLRAQI